MNNQEIWWDNYVSSMYNGKLKEAILYKQQNIPDSLFKYDDFKDNHLSSIKQSKIYLSSPSSFNDVYDGRGIYYSNDFLQSVYDRFGLKPDKFQKEFDCLLDSYYEHCGIACLTEDRNNYPMWWSYAHDHAGYCIEYDMKPVKDSLAELYPVLYLDQKFNFDQLLIALTDNLGEHEPTISPAMFIFHIFLGTMKHSSWSYEKEWRYIKIMQNGNVSFPAKIKAIYLGCKFEKANIPVIEGIAKDLNFNIYQLTTSDHTHKDYSFTAQPV